LIIFELKFIVELEVAHIDRTVPESVVAESTVWAFRNTARFELLVGAV